MTTELVVGATDSGTLALVERDGNAAVALALLSEADFERRLTALKLGKERVKRIQREMMTEGEDFGVIPGTKKPTLLKPGAETLCQAYTLVPTFTEQMIEGDGETRPDLRVLTKCFLHLGSKEGPIVGEGVGAANSWERRYRYRSAQRACPSCGCEGTIRRSRFEDRDTGDKGWYCHDKAGGCGAKFLSRDPKIADQQAGQVDNPDPYDIENTLYKMAAKRAQIDAVLRATATSGLFTQDSEDSPPPADGSTPDGPRAGERKSQQPPPAPTRAEDLEHAKAPMATAARAAGPHVGKVVEVRPTQNGHVIKLNTGFQCGVRDAQLLAGAQRAKESGAVLELIAKAASDPKYLPVLQEILTVSA